MKLEDFPEEDRASLVLQVSQYLTSQGYVIMGPDSNQLPDTIRDQTFADAAEIALGMHGATPLQIATRLKQRSMRIR